MLRRTLTAAGFVLATLSPVAAAATPSSAAPTGTPAPAAAANAAPVAQPNAVPKRDVRFNDLRSRTVSYAGTVVLSHAVVARHDKQSHATIQRVGRAGVNAEAKCRRANGGTRWYRSTIRATRLHADSHYDCDNNGTYNRAIVGLGLFLS